MPSFRRMPSDETPGRPIIGPNDDSRRRPQTPEEIAAHNERVLAENERQVIFPWEKDFNPFGKTPMGRSAAATPFNKPRVSPQQLEDDFRIFDEAEARIRRRR